MVATCLTLEPRRLSAVIVYNRAFALQLCANCLQLNLRNQSKLIVNSQFGACYLLVHDLLSHIRRMSRLCLRFVQKVDCVFQLRSVKDCLVILHYSMYNTVCLNMQYYDHRWDLKLTASVSSLFTHEISSLISTLFNTNTHYIPSIRLHTVQY